VVSRIVVTLYVLCTIAKSAIAQPGGNFFSSSPKPLSQSHAHLDDPARCNDCHVNGSRVVSSDLCTACHKKVATGRGYHASIAVKGRACVTCHKEHKDRGFDVMDGSRSARRTSITD
jgi:hypothetical protein